MRTIEDVLRNNQPENGRQITIEPGAGMNLDPAIGRGGRWPVGWEREALAGGIAAYLQPLCAEFCE